MVKTVTNPEIAGVDRKDAYGPSYYCPGCGLPTKQSSGRCLVCRMTELEDRVSRLENEMMRRNG